MSKRELAIKRSSALGPTSDSNVEKQDRKHSREGCWAVPGVGAGFLKEPGRCPRRWPLSQDEHALREKLAALGRAAGQRE